MTCMKPINIPNKVKGVGSKLVKYMSVPCGKCIGCKQDRSDAWSYRLFCEQSTNKHSVFVTLTYDPAHLPLVLTDSGQVLRYEDYIQRRSIDDVEMTLNPKDLTDYFKRVRKDLPYDRDVKYFACGEYGENDHRPHYHFALFYDKNDPGLVEAALSNQWKFGFVQLKPLIFNRITYLTKYITDDSKFVPTDPHQYPYFNRSSQGLGIQGYINDSTYYGADKFTTILPSGKVIGVPRYFRKKFLIDNDFNIQKLLNQNESYEQYQRSIHQRLEQDYKIKSRSQSSEQASRFADNRTIYEAIERVRQYHQRRKKNF